MFNLRLIIISLNDKYMKINKEKNHKVKYELCSVNSLARKSMPKKIDDDVQAYIKQGEALNKV